MSHQTTLPRPDSTLHNVLRTPVARRIRRQATTIAAILAGRLRLAIAAALTLTVATVAAVIGGAFALAALVRGLEQLVPSWVAYGVTAAILLACAALAAGAGAWTVVRLTRVALPARDHARN
ncbi:hypothetical protein [Nocardia rhizosphaerihabitans]|uniref:Superfamily III holin-X n=1 Tax=Nocardia rhizosphaerihabitans TaxID=1691570 RepID=A0ABQ2KYF9_9NOCA|nr:hypothetical protein [Nocardia rhizosphaerihabitans]GGN97033.1 hypothetical protein GCM10011610_62630 [Nocardia rhizosphaerihabitans]